MDSHGGWKKNRYKNLGLVQRALKDSALEDFTKLKHPDKRKEGNGRKRE